RTRRLLHAGHRTYDGPRRRKSSQLAVEEADHPALVFRRLGRDPGDVLAVRDLPDLLRLAGDGVERTVWLLLRPALAVLAVDEEAGRRRDLRHLAFQARRRRRA